MPVERYVEEQRLLRRWMWPILLAVMGLVWYLFLRRMTDPAEPQVPIGVYLSMILFGIGMPLLLAALSLRVCVRDTEIEIRYFPIWTRRVPVGDIERCAARTYRPILEFGGWGIRYGPRMGGWCYTVSGRHGVQLDLKNGKKLLIGSTRSQELARAIEAARSLR